MQRKEITEKNKKGSFWKMFRGLRFVKIPVVKKPIAHPGTRQKST